MSHKTISGDIPILAGLVVLIGVLIVDVIMFLPRLIIPHRVRYPMRPPE